MDQFIRGFDKRECVSPEGIADGELVGRLQNANGVAYRTPGQRCYESIEP